MLEQNVADGVRQPRARYDASDAGAVPDPSTRSESDGVSPVDAGLPDSELQMMDAVPSTIGPSSSRSRPAQTAEATQFGDGGANDEQPASELRPTETWSDASAAQDDSLADFPVEGDVTEVLIEAETTEAGPPDCAMFTRANVAHYRIMLSSVPNRLFAHIQRVLDVPSYDLSLQDPTPPEMPGWITGHTFVNVGSMNISLDPESVTAGTSQYEVLIIRISDGCPLLRVPIEIQVVP